ncbi:hypothetical protein Nepgr_008434 [Nepenthes gracilis]|uniref:Uncharacterized protein n=1 Tax=Nepenthes gracilis TaxID=150966 RepID=A0AAD3S9A1_NEPGR|nr:hypothetical protein Nepgr_008434 [Nepenthes gracilis]
MAASSSSSSSSSKKVNNSCHFRSISLPSKSNPIIERIGEELNKLKAWEESSTSTAQVISIGLIGLSDLYRCIDDVLSLPLTQQALPLHHHERSVDELLETSLSLLDICSAARETVLQLKESVRDLRSAVRRRKDGSSVESSIANYMCSRKRIIRSAKGLILSLKRVGHNLASSTVSDDDHDRLSMVIKALRCVSVITISVYESLLFFLSMPVPRKPKSSKWLLVSKLLQRRETACEEQMTDVGNELRNVDVALRAACWCERAEAEKLQLLYRRLEATEVGLEGIENGSDTMFRQLIKTRASLLNVISF